MDKRQEIVVVSPSIGMDSKLYFTNVDMTVDSMDTGEENTLCRLKIKVYGPEALEPGFLRMFGQTLKDAMDDMAYKVEQDRKYA